MLTNTRTIRVQWGDCDPAGIVFYPRYFEWFDACTILLFEKATGMTKIDMLAKYNGAGLALLEARANFKVAAAMPTIATRAMRPPRTLDQASRRAIRVGRRGERVGKYERPVQWPDHSTNQRASSAVRKRARSRPGSRYTPPMRPDTRKPREFICHAGRFCRGCARRDSNPRPLAPEASALSS